MKHCLPIISFLVIVFSSSCHLRTDKTNSSGAMDSLSIALDTAMQLGIEASYEYQRTLALNHLEVYDIVASGQPDSGEVIVIYRNNKGANDTVTRSARQGIIKNSWLTDLNHNGRKELIMALQSYDTFRYEHLLGFELAGGKKATPLFYTGELLKQYAAQYTGFDTIYYHPAQELIYHQFQLTDSAGQRQTMVVAYGLKGDKIEMQNHHIQ